jgi:hypothetical protein
VAMGEPLDQCVGNVQRSLQLSRAAAAAVATSRG